MNAIRTRKLNGAANRVAAVLRAEGTLPDQPVALLAQRSAAAIAAMLGVLKAGGCIVPLDPAYPPERLRYMLTDSGAGRLLHDARARELAAALGTDAAVGRTQL